MGTRRIMALVASGALLGACSTATSNSEAPGNSAAPGTSVAAGGVAATIKEWSITLGSATAASGDVTFTIANGGEFPHEFVIRKTDLAADALPLNAAGEVDESDPRLEEVGELEDIAAGSTANTLTVTLTPGHYVIFCNLHVGTVLHYAEGLYADFTAS